MRYHAAVLMNRMGQFELAQKVLTEFISEANDNPKILEALGLSSLRIPQLPEEVDPSRREAILLAGGGTFYYYSRMTAAAYGRFEELLRRYPDMPNVHYAFGVVLLNAEPDRAIEEFKQELQRTPAHVPAMLQIAFEYLKRSDWTSAKSWAGQAVKIEADSVPARQAVGQALLELDDVAGAIEQLRAGIAIAPETPILHFTLARAYRKAGRAADAERERLEFQRLERDRSRRRRTRRCPQRSCDRPTRPGPWRRSQMARNRQYRFLQIPTPRIWRGSVAPGNAPSRSPVRMGRRTSRPPERIRTLSAMNGAPLPSDISLPCRPMSAMSTRQFSTLPRHAMP